MLVFMSTITRTRRWFGIRDVGVLGDDAYIDEPECYCHSYVVEVYRLVFDVNVDTCESEGY